MYICQMSMQAKAWHQRKTYFLDNIFLQEIIFFL